MLHLIRISVTINAPSLDSSPGLSVKQQNLSDFELPFYTKCFPAKHSSATGVQIERGGAAWYLSKHHATLPTGAGLGGLLGHNGHGCGGHASGLGHPRL